MSLRVLSLIAALVLGLLFAGGAAATVVTTRSLWRAVVHVEDDTRAVVLADGLDRTLREYQRVGNLWLVTRQPDIASLRVGLTADLNSSLVALQSHIDSEAEAERLTELSKDVRAYLAQRESLESSGANLATVVGATRPAFDKVLSTNAVVRRINESDLAQTQLYAEKAIVLETLVIVIAGVVAVAGLLALTLGVRWLVLRPLWDLRTALASFRGGESEVQANRGVLRELRDLDDAFNDMADTIRGLRHDQLTFLAGVAHDLRNPLSVLKMNMQMLERELGPAVTPKRVKLLDRQIDRLARMAGDLLDATRIEAGELDLQMQDLDLRDAARAMVDLYEPTSPSHAIVLDLPTQPVVVHGDPHRIEQVVGNLLSNAIKYSPGGGQVRVVVTAGKEAMLAVSDEGVGIPEDELANVFLPFCRPVVVEGAAGAGLGLSVSRRIISAHGGHIEVDSIRGKGSTFRVMLPLVETKEVAEPVYPEPPELPPEEAR